MAAARRPEPRRIRFTVPAMDVSSLEWLDAQDDPSVSLRLLIHEAIEREGYVDVMNKPVERQPRRGRPPQQSGAASSVSSQAELTARAHEQQTSERMEHRGIAPSDPAPALQGSVMSSAPREQISALSEEHSPGRDERGVPAGLRDFLT